VNCRWPSHGLQAPDPVGDRRVGVEEVVQPAGCRVQWRLGIEHTSVGPIDECLQRNTTRRATTGSKVPLPGPVWPYESCVNQEHLDHPLAVPVKEKAGAGRRQYPAVTYREQEKDRGLYPVQAGPSPTLGWISHPVLPGDTPARAFTHIPGGLAWAFGHSAIGTPGPVPISGLLLNC
jgi:hypothetical protein